ncbi:E3 ubiquitin-protein ligase ATL42-like [Apium graveolens]|uniref:E3 ubiquitin-protein ligase ATL42-like n=1 Tax=Apium graveolens TaxID=4045 RepID=UPI003D7920C7
MIFCIQRLSKINTSDCIKMQKLIIFLMFLIVKTRSQSSPTQLAPGDVPNNFHPSLAAIIIVLCCMVIFTFILLAYAKYCHRSSPMISPPIQGLLTRSTSRYSGIDKTVIESLPFFRFSSLRGTRSGLECSVCLARFEDIEILRLLPTCKHAFHIDCVDKWLEKHSTCPLCRHKVSTEDLAVLTYSHSLRFLTGHSDLRQDSNLEIFVQREEDYNHGSSRFSVGGSFRSKNEEEKEELPIQETFPENEEESLHKFNHRIIVSDAVLKNRWSNVSSSDLMFLNSEMIHVLSSQRFSSNESETEELKKIKAMDRKERSEIKNVESVQTDKFTVQKYGSTSKIMDIHEKRSMSEIVVHPRFTDCENSSTSNCENFENVKEERIRRKWLSIARKTIQWFANRDTSTRQFQNTKQSFDV